MLNLLKKFLPYAAKLIPGAQAASMWRPALIALCGVIAVLNLLVFPAVGVSTAPLPEMFWYFFAGASGIYGLLRTGEKARGKDPDSKRVERLQKDLRKQLQEDIERLNKESEKRIKTPEAPPSGEDDAPEMGADPDGKEGPRVPTLGPEGA